MLNALAHVLPTARQPASQVLPASNAPTHRLHIPSYDKLGKFILLCAIRLLAQFPLKTCTSRPAFRTAAPSPAICTICTVYSFSF